MEPSKLSLKAIGSSLHSNWVQEPVHFECQTSEAIVSLAAASPPSPPHHNQASFRGAAAFPSPYLPFPLIYLPGMA